MENGTTRPARGGAHVADDDAPPGNVDGSQRPPPAPPSIALGSPAMGAAGVSRDAATAMGDRGGATGKNELAVDADDAVPNGEPES